MKLYEYEGKEIFSKFGIPIPQGILVKTGKEARQAAIRIGKEVVVKSQILIGGRGKAGGIKVAKTPEDAEKIAQDILGMELQGYKVGSLLVEEKLDICVRENNGAHIPAFKHSGLLPAQILLYIQQKLPDHRPGGDRGGHHGNIGRPDQA